LLCVCFYEFSLSGTVLSSLQQLLLQMLFENFQEISMCVCVCVRERERQREWHSGLGPRRHASKQQEWKGLYMLLNVMDIANPGTFHGHVFNNALNLAL
jgi:hypothetical protein